MTNELVAAAYLDLLPATFVASHVHLSALRSSGSPSMGGVWSVVVRSEAMK